VPIDSDYADDTALITDLSSVYHSRSIMNVLLPLALCLRSDFDSPWTFYTDGAYSRTHNVLTPYNNGSGLLASFDDTQIVTQFQLSFTSSFWSSSYKAEVIALFVLVSIFPADFTCSIKTDCQALIDTFTEVLFNTHPSRDLKRPLFQIWSLIKS